MYYPYTVKSVVGGTATVEIKCAMCGKPQVVEVPVEGLKKRQQGKLIQDCFPDLDVDKRELFVSGTCTKCWDEMFK